MSPLKPSTIRFDATFEKQWHKYLRRLTAKEKQQLRDRLTLFKEDIFDSRLKTHHLKGNLKQYYAFSIFYSDRIVFKLLSDDEILFLYIGNHDVCY